jgi:hypothetical protein
MWLFLIFGDTGSDCGFDIDRKGILIRGVQVGASRCEELEAMHCREESWLTGRITFVHLCRRSASPFIGYLHFSATVLVWTFSRESGTNWFFIRSFISLDLPAFSEYRFILAEFTKQKDLPQLYINVLATLEPNSSQHASCAASFQ